MLHLLSHALSLVYISTSAFLLQIRLNTLLIGDLISYFVANFETDWEICKENRELLRITLQKTGLLLQEMAEVVSNIVYMVNHMFHHHLLGA